MEKVLNFVKKYKVILGFLFIVLFVFAYSHYTTYTFSARVDNLVESVPFMTMKTDEISACLENLGSSVEESMDEYGEIKIFYATKGDSYVEIEDSDKDRICEFSYTEASITPMFEGINWGDDLKDIKSQLGLNILNTRFTSFEGVFATHVFIDDNSVSTRMPTNRKSWIYLFSDENNKLNRIGVSIMK